jgi:hypothetical protein
VSETPQPSSSAKGETGGTANTQGSPGRPGTRPGDAITGSREETKYQVESARVPALVRRLLEHLQPHRFVGEGANPLPDARHYSTTIYFDTASHTLLRAARREENHNIKLRAREYYDLHSSLAELATDPLQMVKYRPWLWFELKRRLGDHTFKHRVRLDKAAVPGFFRGEFEPPAESEEERADIAAIRSQLLRLSEPLSASVLVNYRRLAFQEADDSLRVTLDLELAFYAAPVDLWSRQQALLRGSFGVARRVERNALIEVKRRKAVPAWLTDALLEARAQPEHAGKFVRAGQAVHGAL